MAHQINFSIKRTILRCLDKEPTVVLATAMGGFAILNALIVPDIRRSLGYRTLNYDGIAASEAQLDAKLAENSKFERKAVGEKLVSIS